MASQPFLLLAATEEIVTHWDSPGTIVVHLLGIFLLVFLNGFFVAAEFALVKVRSSQLDPLVEEGDGSAQVARQVLSRLDSYLSATQFGVTLMSLALGWVGEPYFTRVLQPFFVLVGMSSPHLISVFSVAIGFAVITFLHIILGELAPKYLSIRDPLRWSLLLVRPLAIFYLVFQPFIWVLNVASDLILRRLFRIQPVAESELSHSEEELRIILAANAETSQVSSLGREILINALDLRRRVVRDITTPRKEVIFLNTEDSFEENLRLAEESRHTRFPLCEGHLDQAVGLVHIKDLLSQIRQPQPNLQKVRREILPVPEMMPLERLLSFFLTRHAHLALVVDEFGGTVGIVTLDNVLAELVGDIQDEFDNERPEFQKVTPNEFLVEGTLGLYELKDYLGLDLESEDVSTIGGYVTHLLGHLPREGESVRIDEEFEAAVTKADNRRVVQIKLTRRPV